MKGDTATEERGSAEQACRDAGQLSEEGQEAIVSVILQEIESERRWGELLAQPILADLQSRVADWFLMPRLALSRRLGRDRIDPLADPARGC